MGTLSVSSALLAVEAIFQDYYLNTNNIATSSSSLSFPDQVSISIAIRPFVSVN